MTKPRPTWQTVMLVGAVQAAIGVVLLLVALLMGNLGFGGAAGSIAIVGVLTVAAGVVLSWQRNQ